MKSIYTILFLVCFAVVSGFSQNITEAVRYSYLNNYGTAGLSGMAGSGGAVGGDMGVLTINPASLGQYRSSVFTISPTVYSIDTEAQLLDTEANTSSVNSRLGVASIGVVMAGGGSRLFKTNNLAISWNTNDFFRQRMYYEGETRGTITQRFQEVANGNTVEQLDAFEGYLAYATGAIYDFNDDTFYDSDFKPTTVVNKSQDIIKYGRFSEINIAWGAKVDEAINVGLGLGIPIISYEENKTYVEDDEGDFIGAFNKLTYDENLVTTGAGFNIRAGVQGKLSDIFRVGLSIQSPSWFTLTDTYDTALEYNFTEQGQQFNFDEQSPEGSFKYKLVTPWKGTASAAAVLRSESITGFINLDAEFIDYTNNQFDFQKFSESTLDAQRERELNDNILNELTNAVNLRLGADFGTRTWRLKGGLALIQSPYDLQSEKNLAYSGGLGYRGESFFLDLSFTSRNQSEGYVPYLVLDNDVVQLVSVDQRISNIGITVGFKY